MYIVSTVPARRTSLITVRPHRIDITDVDLSIKLIVHSTHTYSMVLILDGNMLRTHTGK